MRIRVKWELGGIPTKCEFYKIENSSKHKWLYVVLAINMHFIENFYQQFVQPFELEINRNLLIECICDLIYTMSFY